MSKKTPLATAPGDYRIGALVGRRAARSRKVATWQHGQMSCYALRCPNAGTRVVALSKPDSDVRVEISVCEAHEERMASGDEWVLQLGDYTKRHRKVVIMGTDDLKALNEWVVEEVGALSTGIGLLASDDPPGSTWHYALTARRRGTDVTETLTLVVPGSLLKKFLQHPSD